MKETVPRAATVSRRAVPLITYLAAVLLVLGTCGSSADVPQSYGGGTVNALPPSPPVDFVLPAVPVVPAPAVVGYLPGSSEVSPTGQMTYHMPLDVPPGIAGMQPSLALAYSSGAGGGVLGRGWSLQAGESAITRCPKTMAVEHARDGIDFDSTDAYCLDGEKLRGIGNNEYRTEDDSIARIVASARSLSSTRSGIGSFLATPPGFTVYLKNGRIRTYEALARAQRVVATAQSLTLTAGAVLDWPLKEETDRSGNAIRYFYIHNQSAVAPYDEEVLLDRIEYTSTSDGTLPRRRVEFQYTDRSDPSFVYHSGIRYRMRKRLEHIFMYAPRPSATDVVWSYDLGYLEDHNKLVRQTLLESVRKCGYQGGCTLGRHFGWNTKAVNAFFDHHHVAFSGIQPPTAPGGVVAVNVAPQEKLILDANGDGKDDVLYAYDTASSDGGFSWLSNRTYRFLLSQRGASLSYKDIFLADSYEGGFVSGMSIAKSRAVDFRGDGRVGILLFQQGKGVNSMTQTTWDDTAEQFGYAGGAFALDPDATDLADVNGDSLLDLVTSTSPNSGKRSIRLSGGNANFSAASAVAVPVQNCDVMPIGGDLDGDGRGEVLFPASNDCSTSVAVGVDDSGAAIATPSLPLRRDTRTVKLADLNGDGLVDAVWFGDILEISFNTGNGFGPPQKISDPAVEAVFAINPDPTKRSALVMDVDRDGRDDLLERRTG